MLLMVGLRQAAPAHQSWANRLTCDPAAFCMCSSRYAHAVKRQKTSAVTQAATCDFIAGACPTKSGDRHLTYHQFVTDDALYNAYKQCVAQPVSFSTFAKYKQWMRVVHEGKYLGQFDCGHCARLPKLPALITAAGAEGNFGKKVALEMEQQRCLRHSQLRETQRASYTDARAALLPRQALVLMDFTSIFLQPKIGGVEQRSSVQDLIVVME
jgi:hypothetical protein